MYRKKGEDFFYGLLEWQQLMTMIGLLPRFSVDLSELIVSFKSKMITACYDCVMCFY